ncbi:hypothetical protein [Vibrio diabolicus]|nr:hypothetical protein [Vibrio diabolicus]
MISSHEVSAPSGSAQWQSIDWKAVERHVLRHPDAHCKSNPRR